MEKWNISLQEYSSIVAVDDDVIVAFGDIDKTGYLDRLYVHSDYQGKGIATVICNQLGASPILKSVDFRAFEINV